MNTHSTNTIISPADISSTSNTQPSQQPPRKRHLVRGCLSLALLLPSLAAANVTLGQWDVVFYNDTGAVATPVPIKLCLQNGGNFRAAPNAPWNGRWFAKGNDVHFINVHGTGRYAFALSATRLNDTTYNGYYQWIGYSAPGAPNASEFTTASMTFSGACTF